MRYLLALLLIGLIFPITTHAKTKSQKQQAYLFAYFKNNGQDGLHLAYSYDALKWTALNDDKAILSPTIGKDKLMRDPCIIQGPDGIFRMVWTQSWHEKGIGYASSKDLIHWSKQEEIPVMSKEPTARNCWAPEITYDVKTRQYMIYWATTIPGRFKDGSTQGDDNYNHRIYYTLTKDFIHYSPTKLLFDPKFNCIDATIKAYKNGYIMVVKDETKKPAKKYLLIAQSNQITGPYEITSPKPISPSWVEGPTMLIQDNEFTIYYDEYTRHHMGAIQSNDLKNWSPITNKLTFPQGTRHGTILKIKTKTLNKLLETDFK